MINLCWFQKFSCIVEINAAGKEKVEKIGVYMSVFDHGIQNFHGFAEFFCFFIGAVRRCECLKNVGQCQDAGRRGDLFSFQFAGVAGPDEGFMMGSGVLGNPCQVVGIGQGFEQKNGGNDMFVNLGLGIYGLKERGYEGGMVKEILVRIFERNDRAMNVKELCKEMLKEKMVSPNTVMLNLQKYKDLFTRVEKGVYELKK